MSRYIRGRIGYDQRSGMKRRYGRIVEDGHVKGLYVDERDADQQHPQERPVMPVDAMQFLPIPPNESNVVRVDVGRDWNPNDPSATPTGPVVSSSLMGGYTGTVS